MKYWDEKNKRLLTEEEMSQVNPVADTSGTEETTEETTEESQSNTSEDVKEKKEDKKKTSKKKQGDA